MNTKTSSEYDALVSRYIGLWNGGDANGRRSAICGLWADDATHTSPTIAVRGLDEIEARVTRSVQRWIVEQGNRFRPKGEATGHHNVVRFMWEMVDGNDIVETVGTEILVLDEAGKICCAFQFIEQ
jgi:hypothetical protein